MKSLASFLPSFHVQDLRLKHVKIKLESLLHYSPILSGKNWIRCDLHHFGEPRNTVCSDTFKEANCKKPIDVLATRVLSKKMFGCLFLRISIYTYQLIKYHISISPHYSIRRDTPYYLESKNCPALKNHIMGKQRETKMYPLL